VCNLSYQWYIYGRTQTCVFYVPNSLEIFSGVCNDNLEYGGRRELLQEEYRGQRSRKKGGYRTVVSCDGAPPIEFSTQWEALLSQTL